MILQQIICLQSADHLLAISSQCDAKVMRLWLHKWTSAPQTMTHRTVLACAVLACAGLLLQGIVYEFRTPNYSSQVPSSSSALALVNGLWSLLLAMALLCSCLFVMRARSWRLGNRWLRANLANYGVPLMVLLWTGVSFAVMPSSPNVPRRVTTPNSWQVGPTRKCTGLTRPVLCSPAPTMRLPEPSTLKP
jgi:hypothetical protein